MERFYFTYGTSRDFPFRGGWTMIIAPNIKAAALIFKAYHPNPNDDEILNCADYYKAEYFEKSESFMTGNFGGYWHEIIGPHHLTKLHFDEAYKKGMALRKEAEKRGSEDQCDH